MNWYKKAQIDDIHQHLQDRGVDLSKTHVYVDPDSNTATFPIQDPHGRLVGYQQYNPNAEKRQRKGQPVSELKYYTYLSEQFKRTGVWGLETVPPNADFMFVTEGVFDAVKIHNAGYPAIAVLGNAASKELKAQFQFFPKSIAILDNDQNEAGNILSRLTSMAFKTPDPYGDLGDMPQEEVNEFLNGIVSQI